MDKRITFKMAEDGSRYDGTVVRRVTSDLSGSTVTLSETTTGQSLKEFKKQFPDEPIEGIYAGTFEQAVSKMSDDELAAMGLARKEGVEQAVTEEEEPEDLSPSHSHPRHLGFGTWELSDGSKVAKKDGGKDKAIELQADIDAQATEGDE